MNNIHSVGAASRGEAFWSVWKPDKIAARTRLLRKGFK